MNLLLSVFTKGDDPITKYSTVQFDLCNHLHFGSVMDMANFGSQKRQNYSGIFSLNPAFFALIAVFMAHDTSPLIFIRSMIFINID